MTAAARRAPVTGATGTGGTANAAAANANAWSTPRKLRTYQVILWVLAALLFLAGEGTLGRARSAMKTIGRDAAPSIVAAQEINSALADLDANAANYLIGTAHHRVEAMRAFEARRVQATTRLVDAAQNITYGDAEKQPILTMIQELGRYLEAFAEARYRYDTGDTKGALETYRVATTIMHGKILPAATALDSANKSYMDAEYEEQRRASSGAEVVAVGIGGALLAALVVAQLFIFRRMRRILNPGLAGATVLALFFTGYLVQAFGDARADLKVAKQDAFESIHVLWKARALAFDANGDESRYLLDRPNAPIHESLFLQHVHELTSDPLVGERTSSDLIRRKVAFRGLLADELNNVTFRGEWAAAEETVRAFAAYVRIDARIRELENSGKHEAAVQLCIGGGSNESNAAFDRFDQALTKTIAINREMFDDVIERGDDALRRAEFIDPAVAIAIAVLTWLGLRARIREYAV